jgi:ComF family protein
LRDLIHALKYGGRFRLAAPLGAMIAAALEAEGLKERARRSVLVPVPLSARRRASRGYNQAALLARETARGLGLPRRRVAARALKRVKEAPPQAGLGRAERLKNPAGTYAVDERKRRRIEGRHVLLVDDVLTTGATAGECARLLLEAGAADVIVAVVARTPPGGDGIERIDRAPASAPGRNE